MESRRFLARVGCDRQVGYSDDDSIVATIMSKGHIRKHLAEYWASLRTAPTDNLAIFQLGAVLQCPVFVINLERSVHRRQYILKYLDRHGIAARIFPAVDGTNLDLTALQARGIYDDALAHQKFDRSLRQVEVATTWSHLKIHQAIVDENIAMALVLEDDALFEPNIVERVSRALVEAPPDWEVLQMFHTCSERTRVGNELVRFPAVTALPVGAAGYLMRLAGARKMVTGGFPICYPADSMMGRCHRWGVVMYGFDPPALTQNAIFPTQIYVRSTWLLKIKHLVKHIIVSATGLVAKVLGSPR